MNLIVDGTNFAHRARHAFQLSYKGKDVSVTYGVVRMLLSLVKKHKPHSVVFCWDGGTPGFRRRLVPTYKSTRRHDNDPTWFDFLGQLDELGDILPHFGVLQVRRRGMEADDLIAQAAKMLVGKCLIISTDDDLLQCVTDDVSVLKSGKKDVTITSENFVDVVGYPTNRFVMAKVLMGDSSDNVHGVRGVGPKTAQKMMLSAVPLDAATDTIRGRIEEFVRSGKFNAAYTVIELGTDLTGARKVLLDAEWTGYDNKSAMQWCLLNGFTSLIEAGPLGVIFGKLQAPEFDCDGLVVPLVWDYEREI